LLQRASGDFHVELWRSQVGYVRGAVDRLARDRWDQPDEPVDDRGWSADRFEQWLADSLARLLLD
jgi:hypothetical protein